MPDNRVYIKHQICQVAAAARASRKLEEKQRRNIAWAIQHEEPVQADDARRARRQLSEWRRVYLRRQARAHNLAYAFIRGRSYRSVEPHSHEEPDWEMVRTLVKMGGNTGYPAGSLQAWMAEPEIHTMQNWCSDCAHRIGKPKASCQKVIDSTIDPATGDRVMLVCGCTDAQHQEIEPTFTPPPVFLWNGREYRGTLTTVEAG